MDLKEPPTCIIYPDDLSVTGGINALRSRGLNVPDDISVAGYDGIKLSQMLNPRITTVKQDTDTIGRTAARELINEIEKPKNAFAKRVMVQGEVLPGESVGKVAM